MFSVCVQAPSCLLLQQLWIHPAKELPHMGYEGWASYGSVGQGMQGPDQTQGKAAPATLIVPCTSCRRVADKKWRH